MTLQSYLEERFSKWTPSEPLVTGVTKHSVTLSWEQEQFQFVRGGLLYRVQRRDKWPPWTTLYSGGKTTVTFHDLAPSTPYKFRLKVILRPSAVSDLAEKALAFYGDEKSVRENLELEKQEVVEDRSEEKGDGDKLSNRKDDDTVDDAKEFQYNEKNVKNNSFAEQVKEQELDQGGSSYETVQETTSKKDDEIEKHLIVTKSSSNSWLESQWSEETWSSTEFGGTSVICFCMSVRGGYVKQLQTMLDQRPELIELINPTNGLTPLITAIMKGNINTVRFLLNNGAAVEQPSAAGHLPLHMALLTDRADIVDVLLDRGAKLQSRDRNSLRAEHYAADSGSAAMVRLVAARGGDFTVTDSNGWTPLFRAVCENASTELIEALLAVGSSCDVTDFSGLHLASAARLLVDAQGRTRENILRMLDAHYPRELAVANFSRLTKKISRVHTVFKL